MNDDANRTRLAGVLRQARQGAGLSQRELEMQTGIPKTTIIRFETRGVGSGVNLLRLARALELRAIDLFATAGLAMPKLSVGLPAMLRAEYDLPPEAISQIQRDIEAVAKRYEK